MVIAFPGRARPLHPASRTRSPLTALSGGLAAGRAPTVR